MFHRFALCFVCLLPLHVFADELKFEGEELKTHLTVGYAVRLIDMNDDEKLDIVVVDSKRFLWLENPTWKEHVMEETQSERFDNVCFAPHDIDGDGDVDFAVGSDWQFGNTKSGGFIGWLQNPGKQGGPWRRHAITTEPTTHRMQFADIDRDDQPELIVAPLKGRETTGPDFAENGVRLLAFEIPKDPAGDDWPITVINDELHVMHNFWPCDVSRIGQKNVDILTASFQGVNLLERQTDGSWLNTHIGEGEQQTKPNRGASEIKFGRITENLEYIATIEPWHGHEVVVYTPPERYRTSRRGMKYRQKWTRSVLDDDLKWGHAVWCANLDDDPEEELIIGVRDHKSDTARSGLRIYDPQMADFDSTLHDRGDLTWKRHVIDPGGVRIEDLAAADLNGDGRVDIVAVGRQSHNVKIYWNKTK